MRVAVTGATGVIGSAAVAALVAAGHDVVGMARTPQKAVRLEAMGAEPVLTSFADHDGLTGMFEGCDAVCNFATHVPVGFAAALHRSWRTNDRLRTEGVRRVVEAVRAAGVRRLVQESVSFLYADQGEDWVDEASPVSITPATEPASVAECHVQEYQCESRVGVVLRFGTIVGDDALTRWQLRAVASGRPIGLGSPEGWVHVVHTDDLGQAVLAALSAPTGVYNVGAEPLRRADLVHGYAEAVGRHQAAYVGPFLRRLAGTRVEPLTRSIRVSSDRFTTTTGWKPVRDVFDPSWFDVVAGAPQAAS